MPVDNVTLEILRNYFQAIVEDMARVVERTAFTPFLHETAELSTGLIAPNGEYVAYPWRLGALPFLGINMKKAIDYTPHYDQGDLLIMNDPYTTRAPRPPPAAGASSPPPPPPSAPPRAAGAPPRPACGPGPGSCSRRGSGCGPPS